MKFEQPTIELLKIKTEEVAAGILDNRSDNNSLYD